MVDLFVLGQHDQRRTRAHARFKAPVRQRLYHFVEAVYAATVAQIADNGCLRSLSLVPRLCQSQSSYTQNHSNASDRLHEPLPAAWLMPGNDIRLALAHAGMFQYRLNYGS